MIRALNPKILTSEDSSYKTVKELNEVIEEALKKGEIKNILDHLAPVRVQFY